MKSLAVIGGGAAGFFAAINAAEMAGDMRVIVIEKSKHLLAKVKISGGGRCNVTHACFDPKELVRNYPRGHRELLGPFHSFQPGDMFDWLERRGVPLKTEEDGRVFPLSDKSQSIIDCFMKEAERLGVQIQTGRMITQIERRQDQWQITFSDGSFLEVTHLIIATGSGGTMWNMIKKLGHTVIDPVPSLFTFNIRDPRIEGLAGISAQECEVRIEGTSFASEGPVLITHWGLSGPGILKLSAWAARELARLSYDFDIRVNWDTRFTRESCFDYLRECKSEHARSQVKAFSAVKVPHRLWLALLSQEAGLAEMRWADLSHKHLEKMADAACNCYFRVNGKSTFKDEFVSAGGVDLREVDFRSMQSKVLPGLYFAGEVLDIDAITGGFNFQAAWTTAYLAAKGVVSS